MKFQLLMTALLVSTISCGKRVEHHYITVENDFDPSDLEAMINANDEKLQRQIDEMLIRLGNLETKKAIVLVDPCPSVNASFREKLLQTADGELLSYFEQGNNRFLSTLNAGNYRTTDSRACNFTVNCVNNRCNVR